jgi:hypothetical protein
MNWILLLGQLITGMSPEVREEMKTALDKMQEAAKKTKLPFDDIGVMLLRAILGL